MAENSRVWLRGALETWLIKQEIEKSYEKKCSILCIIINKNQPHLD